MASHDLILPTYMTKNHYHNSCEANFRTISTFFEMLWIDIRIRDTDLLKYVIVVNSSTRSL